MNETPPNAIVLSDTATIRCSTTELFDFLVGSVPTLYPALSRGHERFEVVGGGPLVAGATIDCRERTGNQEVHHRYLVQELTAPRRLRYASTPSTTFVHLPHRTISGQSDTFVTYELERLDTRRTKLDMTIVIAFSGLWPMLIARTLGRTVNLWKAHQREELDKLTAIVEADKLRREAATAVPVAP